MGDKKDTIYKNNLNNLLDMLERNYSEKLDCEAIVPLFKKAEEAGIDIKNGLGEQINRYNKIIHNYIEKKDPRTVTINTYGPVTPEQFNRLIKKREGKVKKFRKRLDFLIGELTPEYNQNADKEVLSVFGEAEKEGINPVKEFKTQYLKYYMLSKIKEIKKKG